MSRVLVVGAVTMDVIVYGARLPVTGETLSGYSSHIALGGKGANQAVAAKRAGAPTLMVGAAGTDQFGDHVQRWLADNDIDLMLHRKEAPTGIGVSMVGDTGENVIMVFLGANATLSPADLQELAFSSRDIVLLQAEVSPATNIAAVDMARAVGSTVIFNFAPFSAGHQDLLPYVDYVVVNEIEFEQWQGLSATAAMESLAGRSGQSQGVIVTLGPAGAIAAIDGTLHEVPGHLVDARDPTGAGDCFCGYFAASLALGRPVPAALAVANAAAAISVQRLGGASAVPFGGDVAAFVQADPAPRV